MASLQARHQRSCALYPWTPFKKAAKAAGCTCEHPGPLYHVTHRVAGKLKREPVGHNRKEAERELKAFEGDVARGRSRILKEITFDAWAEEWLASFTGKDNSRRVYEDTIAYASATFGSVKVRDLDSSDVRRFLDAIREANARRLRRENERRAKHGEPAREVSPATLAKHLRQLGACLEAARAERYAERNAVRELHKSARPRVEKSRPTYYTDEELARLWPELAERPVYAALCKAAVLTGCRFGELAALTWADLDLLGRELHVERTYTAGIGVVPLPKSNEVRTVDLTPQAAALFEAWLVEAGDEGLAFEREDGGHLSNSYALRSVLYPALERAGIPRLGERGRERDFHSFRHTFARIALEHGAEITWVKEQLGHSSIQLTVDLYGSWARSAEKAQAERLGAAFPV